MSKVYDKYRVPGEPDVWYLKLSDGSIYGPEEHSVVYRWASEGRIAPGDQMSQDKITWVFAENVTRLRMEWLAETGGGRNYGPFNLLAVPNLVRHGTFKANARLVNKYTGKSLLVEEVLKPTVAAELAVQSDLVAVHDNGPNIAGPVPPIQEQPKQSEPPHKGKDALHQKYHDGGHRAEELQKRTTAAESELSRARKELDDLRSKHHAVEADAKPKHENLTQALDKLEKEKEAANRQITELKKELDLEKSRHTSTQSSVAEKEKSLRDQSDKLHANVESLEKQLAETRKKLEEQNQKSLALADEKLRAEQELGKRIEHLLQQSQAAQNALEKAETELRSQATRHEASAKEAAGKQETLNRRLLEIEKELNDKNSHADKTTRELENEKRLRDKLDAEHKEDAHRLSADLDQSRKQLQKTKHELDKEQKDRESLAESAARKEKDLWATIGERTAHLDLIKREMEKEKSLRSEMESKNREKLAGLETETGALKAQAVEAAKRIEKEAQLRTSLENKAARLEKDGKENSAQAEKEIKALKAQATEAAKRIEKEAQLRTSLEDKAARLEKDGKENSARAEKEMQALKTQTAEAARRAEKEIQALKAQAADLSLRVEKEKEERKAIEKAGSEREKNLQKMVDEKNRIAAQMDAALKKERKEHETQLQSIRQDEEDMQRDLDEKAGLLERTKRELEKERSLRADSEKKNRDADLTSETEIRNLKAQLAGSAKLLEAARLDLNRDHAEHLEFVRAAGGREDELRRLLDEKARTPADAMQKLEDEKQLRVQIEARDKDHIRRLEEEISKRRTSVEETQKLLDKAQKESQQRKSSEEPDKDREQMLKQIHEANDRRTHAEILVQETLSELNKQKEKHLTFVQQAAKKQKELEDRVAALQQREPALKWYVRMQDGAVYGPVALNELCEWSAQCRILPGQEVSQDRQNWTPAEAIPELSMEWLVELPDLTFYGPLHPLAVHELLRDGMVAANAKVINRITNEETSLDKLKAQHQSS